MNRVLPTLLLSGTILLAQPLVIQNVTVIPMDRHRTLAGQTVVIRDGKIASVSRNYDSKPIPGAVTVDGAGKYLIPGLAEMHGHLPPPGSSQELVENVLFLYVANGVTTVRGMQGSPFALETRAAIAAGTLLGPRLYVAGPVFGAAVKTAEQGIAMVQEQKKAGYDLLKISEGMTPEVYDAVAKAARQAQIDFAGHVPNAVGVRGALDAGQRSIDQLDNYIDTLEAAGSPLKTAGATRRARELPFHVDERKLAEIARLTRDHGVWNIPTMALWEIFHNGQTGEELRGSLTEVRYMPRTTVTQWVERKNALLKPGGDVFMGYGVGGKAGPRVIELRRKLLAALRDAGAPVALGTDSPQVFSVPGFSLHREIKVMAEVGYTPYEILESATRRVAEYFGTGKETGTIGAGKRADLLLLDADPLKDTANLARRAGVILGGKWIPEKQIQERLQKIAAMSERM
jgi:imidazolonepropionase-like amidohydrolase